MVILLEANVDDVLLKKERGGEFLDSFIDFRDPY